jgi:DmsE family decaheme c-type cytochrome
MKHTTDGFKGFDIVRFGGLAAILLLALAVGTSVPAGASGKEGKSPPAKSATAAPAKPAAAQDRGQYAGPEQCQVCHDEVYKQFEATPHWRTMLDSKKGPEYYGCESCHGPGAEHASTADPTKIFNPKGKNTAKVTETCLSCHLYGEQHSNFARSPHAVNDISCLDCHSVHDAKVRQFQLVKTQPELCYTCHLQTRPQFSRPFRHRVNEGLVKCSDCHNPHGGFLTRAVRSTAAQDAVCFTCHVDKAGPFVFEHAPVKTEGCMACHVPHGSSNPRLLKRSQVNLLCLECHTLTTDTPVPGIPTFHNQAAKYQACTLCHTAVHGSNSSKPLFR